MIKKEQLIIMLELHQKWLNDDEIGKKADLREADLRGADLRRADLRWADLRGTDLRGAVLRGADLRGAFLRGADLRRADLRGADLGGADLRGADLRGTNLDFSQLNLSCKGLNFKIDDKLAKQLTYHLINLMQYSNITFDIFNDNVYDCLEDSHLITKHRLPILKNKNITH